MSNDARLKLSSYWKQKCGHLTKYAHKKFAISARLINNILYFQLLIYSVNTYRDSAFEEEVIAASAKMDSTSRTRRRQFAITMGLSSKKSMRRNSWYV